MVMMGHPTLNANVRAAAEGLALRGLLSEFHTTIDTSFLDGKLPGRLGQSASRRSLPPTVSRVTRSHPALEVKRLLLARMPVHSRTDDTVLVDQVYEAIDSAMASRLAGEDQAIYAYEDGAIQAFSRARELGLPRIYDLPIGYWRAAHEVMKEEADLNPSWATTLQGLTDGPAKLRQKDQELELSSLILVASTFTQTTLTEYPSKLAQVKLIPYGAPPATKNLSFASTRKLKALYVGSLTQRKGISYMFDAVKSLRGSVELTVVGRRSGESRALDSALESVTWHASLPHGQILEMMRTHDVLLFPSLFEGFGLVLTEALSQGLPIITTPNTAGPDLISNGEGGWIVSIRDSSGIASHLQAMVDDIDLRNEMKLEARRAAERLSWRAYMDEVSLAVHGILKP